MYNVQFLALLFDIFYSNITVKDKANSWFPRSSGSVKILPGLFNERWGRYGEVVRVELLRWRSVFRGLVPATARGVSLGLLWLVCGFAYLNERSNLL